MTIERMRALKAQVAKEIGPEFSEYTYTKALAKTRRWMEKAYGAVDWEQLEAEGGAGTISAFYRDTLKNPEGQNTFNRGW